MRRARQYLPASVLLAALFGLWELYADLSSSTHQLILPPLHQVARALYSDRSLLWSNFTVTAEEILLGILVAAAAAFALASAMHFSQTVRRAVYPLTVASQAIPIVLLAPIFILWLGFGIAPKLLVIALVCFFPIVVTTLDALKSVDPNLIKLMRTFDATPLRTFRHIELPSALPGVITGAKIAAVIAPIAAVLAELAGANSGLGYLFYQSINQVLAPRAYATVVILSAFAIALFALLTLAERLAVPWAYRREGERA